MIRAYGLDWPNNTWSADLHLWCYRHQDRVRELNGVVMGQEYHLANAARIIYPDNDILTWHPWLEDAIEIWCGNRFATVWGAAACAKSNNFGLLALLDWFSAPEDTCVFVCSTSKKMLEVRIWEAVTRYFNYAKQRYNVPGKISKVRTAIINEKDRDQADDVKAGISGVAVQQGTVEEAQSNLIGAHLPYVRLIVDEMQATRRAAVEARKNLSKGCQDFKFFGLGNPMSFLDLLGEYSEPVNGWESISVESESWETRFGRCYHFDGLKSPAIVEDDGARKYPFLISREQIDRDIQECGGLADHPDIWTMCRGFPPPEGLSNTVLTQKMITNGRATHHAQFQYRAVAVAGLDPAFSSGGNKAVLSIARVGKLIDGVMGIAFYPHINLEISGSSPISASEQVALAAIENCKNYGVEPRFLGIDDSGTQSIADWIEKLGFKGVHRSNFSLAGSDLPVSRFNARKCYDEYRDRLAELWFSMRYFVLFGQIRQLDGESARQFCERRLKHGSKKGVESKKDMKEWSGRSPDDADADAVLLDVVRHVCGVYAGDEEGDAGIFGFKPLRNLGNGVQMDSPEGGYTGDAIEAMSGYEEAAV